MKYVLFLITILFSNQAVALNCEKQPTCEALNYSKDDDPQCADDGYILCPFDFSYKKCLQPDCEKLGFTSSEKSGWCSEIITCPQDSSYTACNCLKPRCNIGDVFYADGSCGDVKDYTSDKIPVGVVYYTNCAGGGKVINLKDFKRIGGDYSFNPENPYHGTSNLVWGYSQYDIPKLANYNSNIVANDLGLFDGKGNTDKILNAEQPTCNFEPNIYTYYYSCVPQVAQAAHDFYPPEILPNNSIVGQGKWYLPAIGELMDLYGCDRSKITSLWGKSGATGEIITIVNSTLKALKERNVDAEELTNMYWSSTEYNSEKAWRINITDGDRVPDPKTYDKFSRASLEF